MMNNIYFTKLRDNPKYLEKAISWFSQKWNISKEAYRESLQKCVDNRTGIPQWYIVLNNKQNIIAGAGVIENDFHDHKKLTPNLCALYVEKEYRRHGIAKYILDSIREDIGSMGYKKLYLVTDHINFYERYGWEFLTMVNDEIDNIPTRMYVAST